MPRQRFHIRLIDRGDPPPCLETKRQCRNCYGWDNMLSAARNSRLWRKYPLCCPCTGLTVRVVSKPDESE